MPTPTTLVVALLASLLPLAAAAQHVDPKVSPDFHARRALVKSAFRPTGEAPDKSLPPVGLLGRQQFAMLGAAWAQFHRSVSTGDVATLRTVVRNARACKADTLAVKAELLMESRVRMAFAGGDAERSMGEWILAFGPKILPEQIGETATPFVVAPEQAQRVRFGNASFVEIDGGHWRLDLGC